MSYRMKLITTAKARELLKAKKAVRAGSPEHNQMMARLWEQVAKKFVYVVSAGKWTYKDSGTDRGLVADWAAQRSVDVDFGTPVPVLRYGRKDGQVSISRESPQLANVSHMVVEERSELKLLELSERTQVPLRLAQRMVVDFWDTYPGKPRIVELEYGKRVFNLWTEPRVKPIASDKYREPRWFLDVVERFFGDAADEREWFLDWCAHLICRPEVKMPASVLLISTLNGAGKNFMAEGLKYMVGERNYKSVTAGALKGQFQSFIPGTSLIVVSELYETGNYAFADSLKTLQSEDELFINLKYGPQENVRNMCHFLAFSNNTMPIHLEDGDRRWFVFASPQREAMPQDWWTEHWRFLKNPRGGLPDNGALGSLRSWFEARMDDIERTGRFQPFARPLSTKHKNSIIEDSRSVFYTRLKDMLDARDLRVDLDGRISVASIEEQILAKDPKFRAPPNGQKAADLEALGFTRERTNRSRKWLPPEDYQPKPGLDI